MEYRHSREQSVELAGQGLRIVPQAGIAPWEDWEAATNLLAKYAMLSSGQEVLVWSTGYGALGIWAQRQGACPDLYETNCLAARAASWALRHNGHDDLTVHLALPPAAPAYDVALLLLPKGRDLARLYLLHAALSLKPGGVLYLAGPNRGGIKGAIKDGDELLGKGSVLGYKGGNRVAAWLRPETLPQLLPEPFRQPGVPPDSYDRIPIAIRDETFTVCTRPGVFSRKGLDAGTRLLLENLQVAPDERVLDVGCGYGIIGLYARCKALQGQITMTDIDLLAYRCAQASAQANGFDDLRVLLGVGLEPIADERFSLIVSNPTFHSQHVVDLAMSRNLIEEAHDCLEKRGRLVLVANRFLAYGDQMRRVFGHVRTLAEDDRYHVLSAHR